LSLAPGVAMLLTALSINVVIDAIRDRIDPRRAAA
jgi:ABC-type dipeptide/oligopeptide/nickel transport system permease subunit